MSGVSQYYVRCKEWHTYDEWLRLGYQVQKGEEGRHKMLSNTYIFHISQVRPVEQTLTRKRTTKQKKEEHKMKSEINPHYLQTIADETIKTVGVMFPPTARQEYHGNNNSGKVYTYKTRLKLETGDKAVVHTPTDAGHEYKVVTVVRVDDTPDIALTSSMDYKWIVQKVDTLEHGNLTEQDKAFAKAVLNKQREQHRQRAQEELSELIDAVKGFLPTSTD